MQSATIETAELSAQAFSRSFNAYVNGTVARHTVWIKSLLNAEGVRAARAYERAGGAAAIAEVNDSTYRRMIERIWIGTVPRAGMLVADLLAKAAEDVFVEAAIRWLRLHAGQRIEGMSETSRREIGNQIRIGVEKGETRQQIADRIVKKRRSVSPERALEIARTEVHAAANYGSHVAAEEAEQENGPMVKIWNAMAGARPTHAVASGQRQDLDEPFRVGLAWLEYPGAPGPANEVCNCRCWLTYEAKAIRRPRRRPAAA
jgi:hypothetical protein